MKKFYLFPLFIITSSLLVGCGGGNSTEEYVKEYKEVLDKVMNYDGSASANISISYNGQNYSAVVSYDREHNHYYRIDNENEYTVIVPNEDANAYQYMYNKEDSSIKAEKRLCSVDYMFPEQEKIIYYSEVAFIFARIPNYAHLDNYKEAIFRSLSLYFIEPYIDKLETYQAPFTYTCNANFEKKDGITTFNLKGDWSYPLEKEEEAKGAKGEVQFSISYDKEFIKEITYNLRTFLILDDNNDQSLMSVNGSDAFSLIPAEESYQTIVEELKGIAFEERDSAKNHLLVYNGENQFDSLAVEPGTTIDEEVFSNIRARIKYSYPNTVVEGFYEDKECLIPWSNSPIDTFNKKMYVKLTPEDGFALFYTYVDTISYLYGFDENDPINEVYFYNKINHRVYFKNKMINHVFELDYGYFYYVNNEIIDMKYQNEPYNGGPITVEGKGIYSINIQMKHYDNIPSSLSKERAINMNYGMMKNDADGLLLRGFKYTTSYKLNVNEIVRENEEYSIKLLQTTSPKEYNGESLEDAVDVTNDYDHGYLIDGETYETLPASYEGEVTVYVQNYNVDRPLYIVIY